MPRVHFIIPALPNKTPPGTLFLTGDHRRWSNDPAAWTFETTALGHEFSADFPEGSLLSVKVRLLQDGGQVIEEGDRYGGRAPAHKVEVTEDRSVNLHLGGWQDERQGRGRPAGCAPPREEFTLKAPWGEQPVRLWWPEGSGPGLPLLILHDGHNVFDERPTFAGESWDAAGAGKTLAAEGWPCLIAALPVNDERNRRYVPFPFEMNDFNSGADEYLDWISGVLKPELARRFGPHNARQTAMAGSSFGGLITLYAGLRDPNEYGTLGVFSPAIFPADFELLRWMEPRRAPHVRVWLDMGDHEGRSLESAAEIVQLTHDLAQRLRPKVGEVKLSVWPDHWHDEPAWRARLPEFMRWWLSGLNR